MFFEYNGQVFTEGCKVTCIIRNDAGTICKINDGAISTICRLHSVLYSFFICQDIICGAVTGEKYGYEYSWATNYRVANNNFDYGISDLELKAKDIFDNIISNSFPKK